MMTKGLQWSDMKYLMVLSIPFAVFSSLYIDGIGAYLVPIMNFVGIPLLDYMFPEIGKNETEQIYNEKKVHPFFDWLLYINVPLQYALLFYTFYILTYSGLPLWILIGKVMSMGICCAVLGINTAHELGHRKNKTERFLAKTLLLSSLYMHFIITHNRWHHHYVATPLDPATAKRRETVFHFLFRSIFGNYLLAWRLEKERLQKQGLHVFSFRNEMVRFTIIQSAFLTLIYFIFDWQCVLWFILMAGIGITVLETINYVEHYGLSRQQNEAGKFEKVRPWHSWNSDHILGRIMLLELTRHSDHHYKASRKYQTLRSVTNSPQLILGYPGSLVVSWIPPLWFRIMDKQLKDWEEQSEGISGDYQFEYTEEEEN